MEYKLLTSSSPNTLTENVKLLISEGWEPIGSHHVVVTHSQNRYRGSDLIDTLHKTEYSQTLIKKN